MKLIPLTRGYHAIVDDQDYDFLMQWRWYYQKPGYAARSEYLKNKGSSIRQTSILMHRVILDAPKHSKIDHANRNGLDNRRSNIRFCSDSQNNANKCKSAGKKSKYKGVCPLRNTKWQAYIHHNKRYLHIGVFKTEEEAARAYDQKALELFGEFARTNLPVE